jgi:hypothetical protein
LGNAILIVAIFLIVQPSPNHYKNTIHHIIDFSCFYDRFKSKHHGIGPSGGTWYDNANWSSGDPFNGNAIFNGFNCIISMNGANAAVRSLNITGNSNVVFQNSTTNSTSGLYLQSYTFFPHTVSNIEAGSTLTMSQTNPSGVAQMNMHLRFGDELNVYG